MPGRPGPYSDVVAEEIVRRLMEGESMRTICLDSDMPHRSTVIRWMADDDAFATKCARARELQADAIFDEMQEIADSGNPEDVQRAKLRISTMQWRASKLAPKKYGDKLDLNHGGEVGLKVQIVRFSDAE